MGRRARLLASAGAGLATLLVLGAITDLLPNPVFDRMVARTAADYLFLLATAAFAAAFVHQRALARDGTADGLAAGGILGGFLAFGCPFCSAVLVALLGSSAIATYVDPLRPAIGVANVAVFGVALAYQRRECERCRTTPQGDR